VEAVPELLELLELPELPLEPPPELGALAVVACAGVLVAALFELLSRASGSEAGWVGFACILQADVAGPRSPSGAPPGSGTHPDGLLGSVSLMPGWLGPSHA
jgi:hypothetical protein